MNAVTTQDHRIHTSQLRDILAAYNKASDLINIGAYVEGSNPVIDRAIQLRDPLLKFLRQEANDPSSLEDTIKSLKLIADHNITLSRKAAN
jgi:flagellum-specific ATP synthase